MADRHGRMLAELAELTLDSVRGLHDRLVAAETPAEAQALGLTLARVSRALRQTLLLEAKLDKDRRAQASQDAADEAGVRARRVAAQVPVRKARVRRAVAVAAAESCESVEAAEDLMDDLELTLDDYVRAFDFETGTVEELIATLCEDLGIAPQDDDDPAGDDDAPNDARPMTAETPPSPYLGSVPLPPGPPKPNLIQMPDGGWAPGPDSS
ncbi:MAG: hypothetical protein E7812_09940 [Phenylobacterium sp.]|nr:MAG: hypothetical protein E7812_09940 [Phenylobacterium sp.]